MRETTGRPETRARGNELHADRALRAVEDMTAAGYVPGGREELSSAIERLLADLRHLCDRYRLNYGPLDRNAVVAYYAELAAAPPVAPANAGCDRCGSFDRAPCSRYCEHCVGATESEAG